MKVDGHDAELVVHAEGVSVDECWEETGRIRTREHHRFGPASGVLPLLGPEMTGAQLQSVGFETVERADQ